MPVDLTEYIARFRPTQSGVTSGNVSTYKLDPDALEKTALEVVRTLFPDYIKAGSSKMVAEEPAGKDNATYTWSPFAKNPEEIRIAKMQGRYGNSAGTYTPTEKGISQGRKPEAFVDFNVQEVMSMANTLLHEMYHDRSKAGARGDRKLSMEVSGVTPEDLQKTNKLARPKDAFDPGALYSMNESGLNIEEFLANAVPLLDMRDRNAVPEKSRSAAQLRTVEQIMTEIPSMAKFIESQRTPEIKSLKAPETPVIAQILELFRGATK